MSNSHHLQLPQQYCKLCRLFTTIDFHRKGWGCFFPLEYAVFCLPRSSFGENEGCDDAAMANSWIIYLLLSVWVFFICLFRCAAIWLFLSSPRYLWFISRLLFCFISIAVAFESTLVHFNYTQQQNAWIFTALRSRWWINLYFTNIYGFIFGELFCISIFVSLFLFLPNNYIFFISVVVNREWLLLLFIFLLFWCCLFVCFFVY